MDLNKISYEEFLSILISKAVKDQVEIDWTTNPEGSSISIRPWKPLQYVCPHQVDCNNGENK